ncbi:MAG: VWA domain-containing protein [Aliarcobacter sp.]|nr:VWA domain-containing protein [Aliarcobacter sp.]
MLIPSFILMYLIITKQSKIGSYFSKNALEKLSVSNQYFSNKARNITLFLSLIFMIIALARPVTNEKINDVKSELNAVVIAIDVSKSMNAIDIYPNRLEFAKTKLLNIIETSKSEAIGVILFAKSAFLLSAVTQDFTSLKLLINNLNTGINFDNGTNIFSTLETTQKLLKDYKSKNLILLTDGADNTDFKNEIEFANKNNINIYTLALGTTQGSVIKQEDGNYLTDSKGNIVNVKLNENIKELSLKTKGGYINFSLNNDDINLILNDINSKSKKEIFDDKKYKTYTELFYYPLAIGIFLLLLAFSSFPTFTKNKLSSIVLICLFSFVNTKLNASSILDFNTIKEATQAYETKDYNKASNKFEKLDSDEYRDYNLANSFYKTNDFDKAINLYENIKSSNYDLEFKRLHNLGNSYAKKNDFQNAITNYENALKLKNDKETKENLELLKKALEDKKNKENKENKEQDKKQEPEKNDDSKENQNNEKDENKEQNKENNKSKDTQKKQEEKNQSENQKQEMSNYEEEKWMKEIENQKTNSLLKKMESSKENSISNPW